VHSPELLLKKLGWWCPKKCKILKVFWKSVGCNPFEPRFWATSSTSKRTRLSLHGLFFAVPFIFLLREERQTHMLAEWVHRAKSPVGYANIFLIFRFAFSTFLLGRLDSRLFSNSLGSKVVIISRKRVILPRVCLWVFCVISQDAWELRALWLH